MSEGLKAITSYKTPSPSTEPINIWLKTWTSSTAGLKSKSLVWHPTPTLTVSQHSHLHPLPPLCCFSACTQDLWRWCKQSLQETEDKESQRPRRCLSSLPQSLCCPANHPSSHRSSVPVLFHCSSFAASWLARLSLYMALVSLSVHLYMVITGRLALVLLDVPLSVPPDWPVGAASSSAFYEVGHCVSGSSECSIDRHRPRPYFTYLSSFSDVHCSLLGFERVRAYIILHDLPMFVWFTNVLVL